MNEHSAERRAQSKELEEHSAERRAQSKELEEHSAERRAQSKELEEHSAERTAESSKRIAYLKMVGRNSMIEFRFEDLEIWKIAIKSKNNIFPEISMD